MSYYFLRFGARNRDWKLSGCLKQEVIAARRHYPSGIPLMFFSVSGKTPSDVLK